MTNDLPHSTPLTHLSITVSRRSYRSRRCRRTTTGRGIVAGRPPRSKIHVSLGRSYATPQFVDQLMYEYSGLPTNPMVRQKATCFSEASHYGRTLHGPGWGRQTENDEPSGNAT